MTGARIRFALALVVALTLVPSGGADAQIPERSELPELQQPRAPLEVSARRFALLWVRGDIGALGALLATRGIRIDLRDKEHTDLPSRNAVAALRELREGHRTLDIAVRRVSESPGSPPRGFAELSWKAVATGTTEALEYDVYLGYVWEDGGWMVTEVRVLR